MDQKVKAIVIACNTASAFALSTIAEEIDIPVIGVIESGARTANKVTRNDRVGVIATEGTVRSNMYSQVLQEINPALQVFSKACPLFVPLVEENWLYDSVTVEIAERYLYDILCYDIDTLVLGCTHYPLIRRVIQRVVGDDVTLVSPAYETAKELELILEKRDLLTSSKSPSHHFYVSDSVERFRKLAGNILSCDIESVSLVNVEQ